MKNIKRWAPLLIITVLMIIIYFSGLTEYFTFISLKSHRENLISFVTDHTVLASLLFIGIYLIVIALSLPIGSFLTIAGGFLFPQPFCTLVIRG